MVFRSGPCVQARLPHLYRLDCTLKHDFDPGILKLVLVLEVTWDLRRGSGGRVRAGQPHEDDVLARHARSKVNFFRGEAKVKRDPVSSCAANEPVASAAENTQKVGMRQQLALRQPHVGV